MHALCMYQMVYAQIINRSGEWEAESSLGFWDINRSPNPGQKTKPIDSKQKKKCGENLSTRGNCRPGGKSKKMGREITAKILPENKKKKKKKQEKKKKQVQNHGTASNCNWCSWNYPKKLGKEAGTVGNQKTWWDHLNLNIEIGKILRIVLETWGDLLSLRLQWKTIR